MHLIREVLFSCDCAGIDLLEKKKNTEVQEQAGEKGRVYTELKKCKLR